MSEKVTCKTCPHCIYESQFYWCGLERTENGYVDVTFDWKPLEIQPPWCKLLQKAEHIIPDSEIGYDHCADAMLKMWMDNVVTDGEYNRIMDKLNKHYGKA